VKDLLYEPLSTHTFREHTTALLLAFLWLVGWSASKMCFRRRRGMHGSRLRATSPGDVASWNVAWYAADLPGFNPEGSPRTLHAIIVGKGLPLFSSFSCQGKKASIS